MGDKILGMRVHLSPERECGSKRVRNRTPVLGDKIFGMRVHLSPERECGSKRVRNRTPVLGDKLLRTRVHLSPERECGPKRVKNLRTALQFWGANYLELELLWPQNESAVLKGFQAKKKTHLTQPDQKSHGLDL